MTNPDNVGGQTVTIPLDRMVEIIGSMRNFADVSDRCAITEIVNSPIAMRAWADMLDELCRAAPAGVVEMRICEVPHLVLKRDTLYRFTVDANCERCRQAAAFGSAAPAGGDLARGKIDPSWSLFDRVDFALRDAGFDLDEAANIAALAAGSASAGSGEVGTDDEVIALCESAGIKWLEPDNVLPDGTIDLDGFPGSFDMVTMDEMRALLRKLQQGADYVMVPRRLTYENGAKAALMGEFKETLVMRCLECDEGYVDDEVCDECGGSGEFGVKVPVSWDTIKTIHKAMVAHFDRAASQGQEGV